MHALRPKSRSNARRSPTPIKTRHDSFLNFQRVKQIQEITPQDGLLSGSHCVARQKPGSTVAAQVRNYCPNTSFVDDSDNLIEASGIIGIAVQEHDWHRIRWATLLIGDIQHGSSNALQ